MEGEPKQIEDTEKDPYEGQDLGSKMRTIKRIPDMSNSELLKYHTEVKKSMGDTGTNNPDEGVDEFSVAVLEEVKRRQLY